MASMPTWPLRLSWRACRLPEVSPSSSSPPVLGAYCQLQQLIETRYVADKLKLNQRRRALSLLAGPNKTNFRGRGIDFEEVRSYQPGDDIRTIDWRVTARTGTAHTKIFREERERPVLVVVDQRDDMFFGSQTCCKSVLAAHIAALLCWSSLQNGDRVGGLIFNDREHREVRPRRSRRSVLALLNHLCELNAALPSEKRSDSFDFMNVLVDLRRIAKPGSAIFIVSDFSRALEEAAMEHLYQLSRHMEITAIHCSDPLERMLPAAGRYTVTDGDNRTDLLTGSAAMQSSYREHFDNSLAALRSAYGKLGVPVIEAGTDDAPLHLLQSYYSGGGSSRR
jgi:uncharacterized protein (DUF58 family)